MGCNLLVNSHITSFACLIKYSIFDMQQIVQSLTWNAVNISSGMQYVNKSLHYKDFANNKLVFFILNAKENFLD